VYRPTITFTHLVDFDLEGIIFTRNVDNIADIYMVQRSKTRIDINNGPPWKPKISDLNLKFISDLEIRYM
jgi:hypothetical protein